MGDENLPPDPFQAPAGQDLADLAATTAGFYSALQAHGLPEQRAAEFTTVFLQTWLPLIMMAAASQQQGQE